jgi:hypothetical protein
MRGKDAGAIVSFFSWFFLKSISGIPVVICNSEAEMKPESCPMQPQKPFSDVDAKPMHL